MKEKNTGGCGLKAIVLVIIGIVVLSSISGSFGKRYAEGGGSVSVKLFSDEISAINNGDGITIAAKDSEIDATNTVEKSSGALGQALAGAVGPFIALGVIVLLMILMYARMGTSPDGGYYD